MNGATGSDVGKENCISSAGGIRLSDPIIVHFQSKMEGWEEREEKWGKSRGRKREGGGNSSI